MRSDVGNEMLLIYENIVFMWKKFLMTFGGIGVGRLSSGSKSTMQY